MNESGIRVAVILGSVRPGKQQAFAEDGSFLDPAVEKSVRGVATGLIDYLHRHVCPRMALEAMVREGATA